MLADLFAEVEKVGLRIQVVRIGADDFAEIATFQDIVDVRDAPEGVAGFMWGAQIVLDRLGRGRVGLGCSDGWTRFWTVGEDGTFSGSGILTTAWDRVVGEDLV